MQQKVDIKVGVWYNSIIMKNGGIMEANNMLMSELLEMYPEFKPVWKACGNDKNLRYYVRKAILEHHKEETA